MQWHAKSRDASGHEVERGSTIWADMMVVLEHRQDWISSLLPKWISSSGYLPPSMLVELVKNEQVLAACPAGIVSDREELYKLLHIAFPSGWSTYNEVTMEHAEWVLLRYGKQRIKSDGINEAMTTGHVQSIHQMFNTIDKDHSGSIDRGEMRVALEMMGHKLAHNNKFLSYVMRQVDQHNDGKIDFCDFVEFVAKDAGLDISVEVRDEIASRTKSRAQQSKPDWMAISEAMTTLRRSCASSEPDSMAINGAMATLRRSFAAHLPECANPECPHL